MRAPAAAAAAGGYVPASVLPRWSHGGGGGGEAAPAHPACPHDPSVNDRLAIWHGDISTLEVDAITNTTDDDESATESNPVSERIMAAAGGAPLNEEILTRGLECPAGGVRATGGARLRCRHVLHAHCPRYLPARPAHSETQLQDCYRSVLSKAAELGAQTLALCLLNSAKRDFPPELAAHVALRTVRRFLEQSPLPHLVIIACRAAPAAALLRDLAPRYYPRESKTDVSPAAATEREGETRREERDGERERRIRIIHNPQHERDRAETDSEDDSSFYDDDVVAEAAAAFARACAPDTQRLLAPTHVRPPPTRHTDDTERYERLLRRARSEDLTEVSGIGCLYQSGVDRLGRPVVVFIGKWFPIADVDLDKALLFLIKLLDPIVRGDYVIAYFHTLASSNNHPPFSWLKEVYTVLPYKYKKNLKAFYIVHPTFWTKMMTWWFTTFMAPAIKAKVHTLPGVEYLYSVMSRDQLELPAFVTEYDMTINGLHYFQPDGTNT